MGIDHDTSDFACASILRWWEAMGRAAYPNARDLLINADGGGSNGSRSRLWKVALQDFADRTGLVVTARHFPPGTSKWIKIEHRLFSHISMKSQASHKRSVDASTREDRGHTTRQSRTKAP